MSEKDQIVNFLRHASTTKLLDLFFRWLLVEKNKKVEVIFFAFLTIRAPNERSTKRYFCLEASDWGMIFLEFQQILLIRHLTYARQYLFI